MSRKVVAPNIYRDAHGFEARVRIGSPRTQLLSDSCRFPPSATLAEMKRWQSLTKLDLQKRRLASSSSGEVGTLAADIFGPRGYLASVRLSALERKRRTQRLQWWCQDAGFAKRRRYTIESGELQRALNGMETAGRSGSTLNKYRLAMSHVFATLDPQLPNPMDAVKEYDEAPAMPRGQAYEVIELIRKYLRIKWVRASSGQRRLQVEKRTTMSRAAASVQVLMFAPLTAIALKRLDPRTQLDLESDPPSVLLTPRRKGKGADAARQPLTPPAVAAFREWLAAGAAGHTPGARNLHRTFVRARDLAEAELRVVDPDADLSMIRPYDLRHSLGTLAFRVSGSDAITGELLQHAPGTKTTRRYRLAAVPAHMRALNLAMSAALPASLPVAVPAALAAPVDLTMPGRQQGKPFAGLPPTTATNYRSKSPKTTRNGLKTAGHVSENSGPKVAETA